METAQTDDAQRLLLVYAQKGDANGIAQSLVEHPNNPYIDKALQFAIQERDPVCVKLLLGAIQTVPHQIFLEAIRSNSKACFELVQPHFDLCDYKALRMAAGIGRLEPLKIIAPHCDPTHKNSEALCAAARAGHHECVQYLLPVSAVEDYPAAFMLAVRNEKTSCVDILLPYIDEPKQFIDMLNAIHFEERHKWAELDARLLNEHLSGVVSCEQRSTSKIKKI